MTKRATKTELKRQLEQRIRDDIEQRASEVELSEDRKYNRAISNSVARDEIFISRLEETLTKVYSKANRRRVVQYRPPKGKKKKHPRASLLVLSDLHFQSLLDPREVPLQYGPIEEARRLASICKQTVEYDIEHRAETDLYVFLIGDIINGHLHDLKVGAADAEQSAAAIELLTQALEYFAANFKSVTVICVPGNHGRNKARHERRAVHEKWDSIENIIYFALKMAVHQIDNITVEIPYTPYLDVTILGHRIFATHGDTVFTGAGNPNSKIDIQGAFTQVANFNAGLPMNERYEAFITGHVHVGFQTTLGTGELLMTNGALVPPDSYALSIGSPNAACGQQLLIITEDDISDRHKFLRVGEEDDKDKSLDSIIKPFQGF